MVAELSSRQRGNDAKLSRLVVAFGVLVIVLVWGAITWDFAKERDRALYTAEADWGAGLGVTMVLSAAILLLLRSARRQEAAARDLRLSKIELTESRDRLRCYVADLERIAEIAAHDLQEPLRRVVSYSQLLERHAKDDEAKLYISLVVEGAQRMKALVSDLEAFVSVDHLPPGDSVASSAAALRVARDRLAEQLAEARASLVVDALPEVAADQASLVEIFVQLLSNAVRFRADHRNPEIHISAVPQTGPRYGMVNFEVRDNGRGIDAAQAARVFEIFYRGDNGGTGTGMGLAIVRRLVERLGGRVSVESNPGSGSLFRFSLPLRLRGEAYSEEAASAVA